MLENESDPSEKLSEVYGWAQGSDRIMIKVFEINRPNNYCCNSWDKQFRLINA